jgi:hypothetical protein
MRGVTRYMVLGHPLHRKPFRVIDSHSTSGTKQAPFGDGLPSQCDEWRITSLAEASRCVASVDLITRVL